MIRGCVKSSENRVRPETEQPKSAATFSVSGSQQINIYLYKFISMCLNIIKYSQYSQYFILKISRFHSRSLNEKLKILLLFIIIIF